MFQTKLSSLGGIQESKKCEEMPNRIEILGMITAANLGQ
jgi:hypothetical protein